MKMQYLSAISLSASLLLATNSFAATEWNMAVGDGGGSTQEAMGLKFSELLKEKTDGEFSATLFVNGQLGSEQATVNDVSMGTLPFTIVGSNNLSPFSPPMGILSLPYIFENIEQTEMFVKSDLADELAQQAVEQANVRVLGWTYSGFRRLTNSKRPVKTLEDLDGLVIRVPKSELIIETYKALGVSPTPVAWSETFTALQQGVVDGQETPYAAIYSMKFAEIQKYLTETHYMFQMEPLLMSESLFQEQSEEVQAALLEAGEEASEYSLEWLQEKESSIKEQLVEEYDLQITPLDNESNWVQKAQEEVWPAFYESVGGKENVNAFLKVLGRDEIE